LPHSVANQQVEVLSSEPVIAYMENVLTREECGHVIALARESIKPALVSMDDQGIESPGRTGGNTWLSLDTDETVSAIARRISELVGIPIEHAEPIQVVHYAKGQHYAAHYDAYNLGTPKGQRCCKKGGQRVATALVYLNDVRRGGDTEFPRKHVSIPARAGRLAIFHNTLPGTIDVHPDSLHAGNPVDDGEKWAFNIWFRARPLSEIQEFEDLQDPLPPVNKNGLNKEAKAQLLSPVNVSPAHSNKVNDAVRHMLHLRMIDPDNSKLKAMIMYSGGADSTALVKGLLEATDHEIFLHHVVIKNAEHREEYQLRMVEKQLAHLREHSRPFEYFSSAYEMHSGLGGGLDMTLALFMGGRYCVSKGNVFSTIWTGHINTPASDLTVAAAVLNSLFINSARRPLWLIPFQDVLEASTAKQDIYASLGETLLGMTVSCRKPQKKGGQFFVCGTCHACNTRRQALEKMNWNPNLVR
jgi:2OG-Fe(II) oxygenase superfamily